MKAVPGKKISIWNTIALVIISIVGTYSFCNYNRRSSVYESAANATLTKNNITCNYNIKRLSGYSFVRPLMFVDDECECEELFPIRDRINKLIEDYKGSGDLISASVYLKSYSKNGWVGINENERFKPGSLLKVPELIAFLKMDEDHPGFLNKKLVYDHRTITDKRPSIVSKSIEPGHSYTIRDLLSYMVIYSDNNATMLLNANIDVNTFKKVFSDIGLAEPDWRSNDYPISAKDYSLFMRELYNASYLSIEDSEFATELLAKSDFKNGLIKDLPPYLQTAHKFGEAGTNTELEFHETALIYLEKGPYLLTVMTKGKDSNKLPQILTQISNIVYQNM